MMDGPERPKKSGGAALILSFGSEKKPKRDIESRGPDLMKAFMRTLESGDEERAWDVFEELVQIAVEDDTEREEKRRRPPEDDDDPFEKRGSRNPFKRGAGDDDDKLMF